MNKYIDHLTLAEYKTIREQLKERAKELNTQLDNDKAKKNYIELRFIILKIDAIIKKYEKGAWQVPPHMV